MGLLQSSPSSFFSAGFDTSQSSSLHSFFFTSFTEGFFLSSPPFFSAGFDTFQSSSLDSFFTSVGFDTSQSSSLTTFSPVCFDTSPSSFSSFFTSFTGVGFSQSSSLTTFKSSFTALFRSLLFLPAGLTPPFALFILIAGTEAAHPSSLSFSSDGFDAFQSSLSFFTSLGLETSQSSSLSPPTTPVSPFCLSDNTGFGKTPTTSFLGAESELLDGVEISHSSSSFTGALSFSTEGFAVSQSSSSESSFSIVGGFVSFATGVTSSQSSSLSSFTGSVTDEFTPFGSDTGLTTFFTLADW